VFAALMQALKDPEKQVRLSASAALRNMGPAAKEALPALRKINLQWVRDEQAYVRKYAIDALDSMGCHDTEVIAALVRALKDKDHQVRAAAVGALGAIGPAAKAALPALVEIIKQDNRLSEAAEETRRRIEGR
jgi:HEAT repeat protein